MSKEQYYPGIKYQALFDHMSNEHGLTLTQTEMDDIISVCCRYNDANTEALRKENERLRKALERIADPIGYMTKELKEGETLNRTLVTRIANDPNYAYEIAKQALKQEEE